MADNHSFNTSFAREHSIEEAIIFDHLYHWCIHNKENNINCYTSQKESEETRKPRFWTYNSCDAFAQQFDYMNKTKIYRVLKSLEEKGFIVSDEFNKVSFDRTKWYAITEKGELEYLKCVAEVKTCLYQNEKCIFQNEKSEVSKMKNEIFQNETTIPTSNTTSETTSNTTSIISDLTDKLNKAKSVIDSLNERLNEATASSSKKSKKSKKTEYTTLLDSEFYSTVFSEYKTVFFGLKNGGTPNAKNYKQLTDAAIVRLRDLGMSDENICSKILEAIRNAPLNEYWRNETNGSFAYIVSETGMNKLTGKKTSSATKGSAFEKAGGFDSVNYAEGF